MSYVYTNVWYLSLYWWIKHFIYWKYAKQCYDTLFIVNLRLYRIKNFLSTFAMEILKQHSYKLLLLPVASFELLLSSLACDLVLLCSLLLCSDTHFLLTLFFSLPCVSRAGSFYSFKLISCHSHHICVCVGSPRQTCTKNLFIPNSSLVPHLSLSSQFGCTTHTI